MFLLKRMFYTDIIKKGDIMSIKFDKKTNIFTIKTKHTMYCLQMLYNKFPVHLYYGKISPDADLDFKSDLRSFAPFYEEYGFGYFPDTAKSEFPFFGNGDFRASALKIRDIKTGSDVTHFTFKTARVLNGRINLSPLPFARENDKTQTLEITLYDQATECTLKLYYTVFFESDVISRYFVLTNNSKKDIRIEKCMMLCLDIPSTELDVISFYGGHVDERNFQRTPVFMGNHSIFSRRGASSHMFNPFFCVCSKKATEEKGDAYGFNLVYSGSFLNEIETDQTGTTRILSGLGSECFNYLLKPQESFISPEAVMTFSNKGIGQVSRNMHKFTKNHILPPKNSIRPVVLNSWEAFYFNIDTKIMTEFAKEAAKIGVDTVVMDDGWFGNRTNDHAGLGDWYPNPDRFPDGLKNFIKKVKTNGVKFGIWIEPEMVNPDSNLYREHPDWILRAPNREPLLSRNQFVLDMANKDVTNYLKSSLTSTLGNLDIDYVKWDMNRHLSNVYSPSLPAERQGEAAYRYMLAVYEFYDWFKKEFPHVFLENCSGGGGRYDLGMMSYSNQIWASDNTNPNSRIFIQYGSTFGYPCCTMSCHVSNHNDSVNDEKLLDYGYKVALNGPLGYEFNVLNVSDTAKATISKQIKAYREYEHLMEEGDFYRLLNPFKTNGAYSYYFVNEDNSEILLTYLQNNGHKKKNLIKLKVSRADKNAVYFDKFSKKIFSGEQLKKGIVIESSENPNFSKMYYLIKQ